MAKMLASERHNVVVIDPNEARYSIAKAMGDIIAINGLSTSIATLKEANARKTDLFIAVNPAENQDMNITCAMLAKQLGAKKVIARIDNDEYLTDENMEMFHTIGIDYLFYPERIACDEIIKLLGQTSTTEYLTFSEGKLLLIVFKLEEGIPIIGKQVGQRVTAEHNLQYRTIAIQREGATIIPQEGEEYKLNDMVYVMANRVGVSELLLFSGKINIDVKNVMILGGGQIGMMVAKQLQRTVAVKVIEKDRQRSEELSEMLEDTLILNGDGRNTDLLVEEDIQNMDAFVAVTGDSETNILACLAAKRMGVKKIIAEIENLEYIKLAKSIGVDTIVNKKLFTASKLFRFTMTAEVQTVSYLTASDAEVLEYIVKPGSAATKGKVGQLAIPKTEAIVGGVVRGDQAIIANDDTEIKPYDRVIVLALPSAVNTISKFFN